MRRLISIFFIILTCSFTVACGVQNRAANYANNENYKQAKVYANNCKNPREKIVLNTNGTGLAILDNKAKKSISWNESNGFIEMSSAGNTAKAKVYDDKLVLVHNSKRKLNYVPSKERTRYLCS